MSLLGPRRAEEQAARSPAADKQITILACGRRRVFWCQCVACAEAPGASLACRLPGSRLAAIELAPPITQFGATEDGQSFRFLHPLLPLSVCLLALELLSEASYENAKQGRICAGDSPEKASRVLERF